MYSVVDAFSVMHQVAADMLLSQGIGRPDGRDGVKIDLDAWYDRGAWLRTFGRIADEIGPNVLYRIGLKIPSNAQFPPDVCTLKDALDSIDVAYHLNHRRRGAPLYDSITREFREGIGHWPADSRRAVFHCDNPYPCGFDQGLITAMAQRFERGARVEHDSGPCRNNGADACTYLVSW